MSISKQQIKLLRRERGWSQEQLAAISGLSTRTVQRIESSGDCSLDSSMALASAFEISPAELNNHQAKAEELPSVEFELAGILGYLSILVGLPVLFYSFTNTYGVWEIATVSIIDGLVLMLSCNSLGVKETLSFFSNSLTKINSQTKIGSFNNTIVHAKHICQYLYTVAFVTALVYLLTITLHAPERAANINVLLVEMMMPILYAILLAEFWIRPYKHKLEQQLAKQLSGS
ncbi:MAG: helix-turn-helix domain-containing protein [Pseudomonadales bacterium]|nr:helix-turn-helix domain-containing protein [Pseudomonadales bacterium]